MYELLVGEIGISRQEFYDLYWWEIQSIIRGYRKRSRSMWQAMRLGAYLVMSSNTDLQKSGIRNYTDLIQFTWEKGQQMANQPNDDDIADLQALIRNENAALRKKKDGK